MCVYVFVSMYVYVHGGQRLTSGVFPTLSILNFGTSSVSEPGAHQCDLTYLPVSRPQGSSCLNGAGLIHLRYHAWLFR